MRAANTAKSGITETSSRRRGVTGRCDRIDRREQKKHNFIDMKELINKLAERLHTETARYIDSRDYYVIEYRTRRRIKELNGLKKDTLRGYGDSYLFEVWTYGNAPKMPYAEQVQVITAAYDIEIARLVDFLK